METKQSPLAVCFVSNKRYLPHWSVTIASFLAHHKEGYEIYLFNEDVDKATFAALKTWVAQIDLKSALIDMKLDTSRLNHFTGYWEKLGKQVFHRLLIPELLPKKHKHALYLDADIVINDAFLWSDFPKNGFPVAAVRDNISHLLAPKRGLEKYFNAGVMWMDLRLWRDENAVEKLLSHQPKITRFAEQEVLNEVFDHRWYELPLKYNFAANHLYRGYKMKNGETPAVIHYAGPIKPWIYWVKGSSLYWKHLEQTLYTSTQTQQLKTVWHTLKHLWQSRVLQK